MSAIGDVDGLDLAGAPPAMLAELERAAADSVKRIVVPEDPLGQSPLDIIEFLETKTVWHPMGR